MGACAGRGARGRGADADAGDGRAPGPRARARRLPRPSLGPPRGDVRRGPVSRRAHGRRVRARSPGNGPRLRRDRHGQAPRRLRRIGGRAELGSCADPAEGVARRLPASVRGGRPRRGRSLRDERVQRDRRRPVRRGPRAPDNAPPRGVGIRRLRRLRLLLGPPAGGLPPLRPRRRGRRRSDARGRPGRRAPEHRLLRDAAARRGEGRRRQRGDGRHRGPPGAAIEVRARAVREPVRPVHRGSRDEQHVGAAQRSPARRRARASSSSGTTAPCRSRPRSAPWP